MYNYESRRTVNRLRSISNLIKVKNDFVEQTNAFHSIVDLFRVKAGKVGNGSEQNADTRIRLSVQLLKVKKTSTNLTILRNKVKGVRFECW
jgi:hypothetical protein